MKTVAWTMTADTAMEFFKRCEERGATTEPERVKILVELAQEGQMNSVVVTNKTRDEYIKEKAKHFRVLKVGKKDETN
jgi:hypothetical protein